MSEYLDYTGLQRLVTKIKDLVNTKQDTLVSGTNIKTINNQSLLGSGDITIGGGTVDSALSTTSENPVQNKVITNELNKKVDKGHSVQNTEHGYTTNDTSQITQSSNATQIDLQVQRTIDDVAGADYEYLHRISLKPEGIDFETIVGSIGYSGIMVGAISESGTDYIRFTTGHQICWGSTTGSAQTKAIVFPKPFLVAPRVVTGIKNSGTGTTQRTVTISNNLSSTGFNAIFSASTDFQCYYIAIGKYK